MSSSEIWEIFKSNYFEEHLQTTTPDNSIYTVNFFFVIEKNVFKRFVDYGNYLPC